MPGAIALNRYEALIRERHLFDFNVKKSDKTQIVCGVGREQPFVSRRLIQFVQMLLIV